MFNETNLFILFLIFALLVIGISRVFFRDTPMFKKRYLPILVLGLLPVAIGAIVNFKQVAEIRDREPELIEACRNALSSVGLTVYQCYKTEFHTTLRYKKTDYSPLFPKTVTVYFDDGINDMWCDMERHGSEWVAISSWSTLVSMCPD